jgi:adenylosuccinate synthase
MPVSIVVGGQYGSEGKGKVALDLVRENRSIRWVVRPGGTNSGHTAFTRAGDRIILRQLPAAAADGGVNVVLPAGSYIEPNLFALEIKMLGLAPSSVTVDPKAHVIRPEHVEWETASGLMGGIGSTGSGTGAAVLSRLARYGRGFPLGMEARECEALQPFLADTAELLFRAAERGERILIEGTQGFGLSPIHGSSWPKATSRDTTAAAFLAEVGLPVHLVDQVVLVTRSFPIRVAGDSGPLNRETEWSKIAAAAGTSRDIREYTSVTNRIRRVGEFDFDLVSRAARINGATEVVLNHLDLVDAAVFERKASAPRVDRFVRDIQERIDTPIAWWGTGPRTSFRTIDAAVLR